jgi:hypothetical protein
MPPPAESAAANAPAPIPPTDGLQTGHCGFEDMHLNIGGSLLFELTHVKSARATVRLIGWLKGHGVIVTLPKSDTPGLSPKEGDLVLIRTFSGRSAYAFRASVLRVASHPYAHLHLTFPEAIEGVAIRRSPRCRTDLAITVSAGEAPDLPARILNLSMDGALIATEEPLVIGPAGVKLSVPIALHGTEVSVSLTATLVGDKTEALTGPGPRHRYALHFENLQPTDRLTLGGYVFYQVYENPGAMI